MMTEQQIEKIRREIKKMRAIDISTTCLDNDTIEALIEAYETMKANHDTDIQKIADYCRVHVTGRQYSFDVVEALIQFAEEQRVIVNNQRDHSWAAHWAEYCEYREKSWSQGLTAMSYVDWLGRALDDARKDNGA